jgi:probable phosphoglycerate mutase
MSGVRLLLIRHGQTPSNVRGALDTGFPGPGLTPLGQAQAQAVPQALAHEKITAVYASPLIRTQLTASPLAAGLSMELRVQPGLEEIAAGALEMRSDDDAVQTYGQCLEAWMCGELGRAMPEGPDGHAFAERFDAALREIADHHESDETVAVFSHGAAIRVYTALRSDIDAEAATELAIMNTGMSVLHGHPSEGWMLEAWRTEPLGGLELLDLAARDVTGESAEEESHEGEDGR